MREEKYKNIIQEYCINEEKKEIENIECEYKERLDKYINNSAYRPACKYTYSEEVEGLWFNPTNIILENGFTFYHHSPEEILEFSLDKRGDFNFLLSQMNEDIGGNILDLNEYPSPFGNEKLYMVRQNGNHRAGVFRTIGLPFATAKIEKSKSNTWLYYSRGNTDFIKKLLKLFEKLDLIKEVNKVDIGKYEVTPKSGLAIWILPGDYCESAFSMVKDIQTRIKMIENLYPDHVEKIPKTLKSMLLLICILICKNC